MRQRVSTLKLFGSRRGRTTKKRPSAGSTRTLASTLIITASRPKRAWKAISTINSSSTNKGWRGSCQNGTSGGLQWLHGPKLLGTRSEQRWPWRRRDVNRLEGIGIG